MNPSSYYALSQHDHHAIPDNDTHHYHVYPNNHHYHRRQHQQETGRRPALQPTKLSSHSRLPLRTGNGSGNTTATNDSACKPPAQGAMMMMMVDSENVDPISPRAAALSNDTASTLSSACKYPTPQEDCDTKTKYRPLQQFNECNDSLYYPPPRKAKQQAVQQQYPYPPPAPSSVYPCSDGSREQLVGVGYPGSGSSLGPCTESIVPRECVPLDLSRLGAPYRRYRAGPFCEDTWKDKELPKQDSEDGFEVDVGNVDQPNDDDDDDDGSTAESDANTLSTPSAKMSWFRRKRRPSGVDCNPQAAVKSKDKPKKRCQHHNRKLSSASAKSSEDPKGKKPHLLSRMFHSSKQQ